MSSSMDRVVYKPLVTSASCDPGDPEGFAYDEHEAECELEARPFSSCSQSYNHQFKKYHHDSLYSRSLAYFGPRQLRILLYLVAILLFLVFIAQLTTNERTPRQLSKSLPATAASILLHNKHNLNDGPSLPNQNDSIPSLSPPPPPSLSSSPSSFSSQPPISIYSRASSTRENSPENIDQKSTENIVSPKEQTSSSSGASILTVIASTDDGSRKSQSSSNSRPKYDNYLSSVIKERNSQKQVNSEEPFDDLHFTLDEEQIRKHSKIAKLNQSSSSTTYSESATTWWKLGARDNDKYVTVTDYIRAMKSFNYNSSITLTTQATTEFIYHTLELCKRWDGPISVAVFTPGPELRIATTLIKFMRQCLPMPLSACIRDKVTWHLAYNRNHGPEPSAIKYPKYNLDLDNYPLFVEQDQCPKLAGPEPSDSIKQFEADLKEKNKMVPINYRQQFKIPYPINVLRNTARLAANTKYVLASDVELYPSINLVSSFSNMLANHNLLEEYSNSTNEIKRFVFTLPIFEVKLNVSAPKTKNELIKLASQGDAIFFHKWVCDACQNFPNRLSWLQTDKFGLVDYQASPDELVVFEVTQRNKTRDSWEPIFIGTNQDPLYDDRLTWDGRRDKMAQMYEMCLQDYHLMVLGNAFLVHAPGIKHIDKNDNIKRYNYMRENNAIYDETMSRLRRQYSTSSNINKC